MSVKVLLNQLELSFWDTSIYLMHQSAPVRFTIRKIYQLFHDLETRKTLGIGLALASIGLTAGILAGLLNLLITAS